MRIGIGGIENSHADHVIKQLNNDRSSPGFRVSALSGGHSDRNDDLADRRDIDVIVDEPADLVGKIDAAFLCARDGRQHHARAVPLLEAGLPIFVDKPLTCDVAEAEDLLDRAERAGVPIASASSLRWAPEVDPIRDRIRTSGDQPGLVRVAGPASPSSEYAGLWFYGIHTVELALTLLGGLAVTDVQVTHTERATVAIGAVEGARVIFQFVEPVEHTPWFWAVNVAAGGRVIAEDVPSSSAASTAVVDRFVEMLQTRRGPLSREALLAPVRTLTAITEAT